ncbi:transglycosylase SLT domain-containing protein [Roseovarius aquimarinus]|uniref:Transglycosylase SLT domain-containing protein n=1 Tax=Roseovarius aquimarinus TaxID=1229156 RepID=A0ABW7IA49_9RHOB
MAQKAALPRKAAAHARPSAPMRAGLLAVIFAACSTIVGICPKNAAASTSRLCDAAARHAAERSNVPLEVLLAITRSETGRSIEGAFRPWPWTVNMEGVGKWFSTRADALAFVQADHNAGARSFDVGCFQVNYRWHGMHFASLDQMFDPEANALYAARFLASLRDETGDWPSAVGAYHSRTPEHAARYRARFDEILAALPESLEWQRADQFRTAGDNAAPTPNTYPLLKPAASEPRFGSLVPLGGETVLLSLFAGREALR